MPPSLDSPTVFDYADRERRRAIKSELELITVERQSFRSGIDRRP
jgi:hypothetical protein